MVRNAWLRSNRVRFRMLLGMLLGIGAPLGWLSIRIVSGESFWEELRNHTGLYLVYADDNACRRLGCLGPTWAARKAALSSSP